MISFLIAFEWAWMTYHVSSTPSAASDGNWLDFYNRWSIIIVWVKQPMIIDNWLEPSSMQSSYSIHNNMNYNTKIQYIGDIVPLKS